MFDHIGVITGVEAVTIAELWFLYLLNNKDYFMNAAAVFCSCYPLKLSGLAYLSKDQPRYNNFEGGLYQDRRQ